MAFKHNIRDEWLARHLGQENPKSMEALMTLMTRFCAGEDSWLARSNNTASNPGTSKARDSNDKQQRNKHKRRKNGGNTKDTAVNARFSGSKSVSGRSHSTKITQARPVWTAYSTVHAKFMAPQEHQPIISIENAGSLDKPVGQVPRTRGRGLKATMTTSSPDYRTQEGKRNFPRKSKW